MTASSTSSTGLDPRLASVLAYSAWWVTGALFLLVERHDTTVRFHAAQAVVVFGAISALIAVSSAAALPLVLVSASAGRAALALSNALWLAGVGLWVLLAVKAWQGERWSVPGAGAAVTRLARPPA